MNKKISLHYTTLNEPVPDFIYKGLKDFSRESNSYHHQPAELVSRLAKKYDLDEDMVFLTAGIDEAILMLMRAHGKSAHIFSPTYIGYEEAAMATGGNLSSHNGLKKDTYHLDGEKIHYGTMIIVANPNNPFGYTPKKNLEALVTQNPEKLIVIDEAYGEFAPKLSMIPEIKKYKNLAVMRSFSKGYGLAGIRIGYVLGHKETIDSIRDKSHYFNTSQLSIGAAITALEHEDYFADLRTQILLRKGDLEEFLHAKKFKTLVTKINCVMIKFETKEQGMLFTDYLMSNDITVSNGNGGSNTGLDKSYVRISIGTKEEIARLMEVIDLYV